MNYNNFIDTTGIMNRLNNAGQGLSFSSMVKAQDKPTQRTVSTRLMPREPTLNNRIAIALKAQGNDNRAAALGMSLEEYLNSDVRKAINNMFRSEEEPNPYDYDENGMPTGTYGPNKQGDIVKLAPVDSPNDYTWDPGIIQAGRKIRSDIALWNRRQDAGRAAKKVAETESQMNRLKYQELPKAPNTPNYVETTQIMPFYWEQY